MYSDQDLSEYGPQQKAAFFARIYQQQQAAPEPLGVDGYVLHYSRDICGEAEVITVDLAVFLPGSFEPGRFVRFCDRDYYCKEVVTTEGVATRLRLRSHSLVCHRFPLAYDYARSTGRHADLMRLFLRRPRITDDQLVAELRQTIGS